MGFGDLDWLEKARPVDGLLFDAFFLIEERLFLGPDRLKDESEYLAPQNNVELTLPDIPRRTPGHISATEATGSERELAAYYVRLIDASRERRSKDPDSSYFWLRPHAWSEAAEIDLPFPWYDTLSDIKRLAEAICAPKEGELISDIDQGWDFEIVGRGDRMFFRLGDGEGQTVETFSISRDPFRAEVRAAVDRTTNLVARLTAIVGRDYWTSWTYDMDRGLIPTPS